MGKASRRKAGRQFLGGRPSSGAGTPQICRVVTRFGHADHLINAGPLLRATWQVPPVLEDALKKAGQPVPPPISGCMLVDTGATLTSIALEVAEELALQQTSISETFGAGGRHQIRVFAGYLTLQLGTPPGPTIPLHLLREVGGIPQLGTPYEKMGLRDGGGNSIRLIGLLGRDFLQHVTMTYRGSQGAVEFVVDDKTLLPGRSGFNRAT